MGDQSTPLSEDDAPKPGQWGSNPAEGQTESFTNSVIDMLYNWEQDDKTSRGSLDAELKDALFTWWGAFDPAVRANVYATIALLGHSAPEAVTDVEIAILAFGGKDHHAAKAVEAGRTDPDWLDSQWAVTFDADWYDDNVHHGGSMNMKVTVGFLAEMFGGERITVLHNPGGNEWTSEVADEDLKAILSGTLDRGQYPGLSTGGDNAVDMAAGIMDALSVVGQVAAIALGVVGTAQMGAAPAVSRGVPGVASGWPVKIPFKNPGGRLPTTKLPKHDLGPNRILAPTSISPGNPAVFRNMEAMRAIGRPAGALKAASIDKLPAYLRLPSYVSMRAGMGTRAVITKAAESQYMINRAGGRVVNRLAGTRLRASTTAAAATVFGSQGTNIYALTAHRGDVEEGRRLALEEQDEREARAQAESQRKAEWGKEENVLARETERREQARQTYSTGEVTP